MSENRPERPPTAQFLEALEVKRNASIGIAVGIIFTVAVYVFFVLIPGGTQATSYYVALAFVLATTTAGTVAIVLTVYSAITLSRRLELND